MLSILKPFMNRTFLPLFCTQYLGAFNDNFFRTAIASFVTYEISTITNSTKAIIIALGIALFMLPAFIFSAPAGELADKLPKNRLIQLIKTLEILIAILAVWGFIHSQVITLLFALFLMGVQAAFFGPVKYSILPDVLPEQQLIAANGTIDAGTYAAILQGTVIGGLVITWGKNFLPIITLSSVVCGCLISFAIPKQQATDPQLSLTFNPLKSSKKILKSIFNQPPLTRCIYAISWFWFLGTVLLSLMPIFSKNLIGGTPELFTLLLAVFSTGIGLGSLSCQLFVKERCAERYAFPCLLVISCCLIDLSLVSLQIAPQSGVSCHQFLSSFSGWRIVSDLALLSFCGGIYVIPLNTDLQLLAKNAQRSQVIAGNNILNALFMVTGSILCSLLLANHRSLPFIFALVALLNLSFTIYLTGKTVLKKLLRFILYVFYHVELRGFSNYQKLKGNAVIIANHTSFLDAALLWAYLPNDVCYAIDTQIAKKIWMQPILALIDFFLIDPLRPMAIKSIIEQVQNGRRVVIFPEGRITTTGSLMKIYPGPALIADHTKAELLPLWIEGAQYSIFSRLNFGGKRHPRSRVTFTMLPPVTLKIAANLTGKKRRVVAVQQLYEIMCQTKYRATTIAPTIFDALLATTKLVGRRQQALEDIKRQPLTYGKLITTCIALGKALHMELAAQNYVGVLLPTTIPAVATILGLQFYSITPCLLNFTSGTKNLLACCQAAKITTVISSEAFIKQAALQNIVQLLQQAGINFIWLEQLQTKIGLVQRLTAYFCSFAPRLFYPTQIDNQHPAVVLFTSGSEGTPKGVVLSHRNIQANIQQIAAVIDLRLQDILFNAMPIFHSFGLTVGVFLPLLIGMKAFLYPSPLHYRIIPELVYDTHATILFGTDTFLNGYAKTAHSYDFHTLRLAVVGAEKLNETTVRKMAEQFGVRVVEGYGATEASPVISLNTFQNCKLGTVGKILPGITMQLRSQAGITRGGRLIVKGDNIMLGYLQSDAPGILQAPENGWYDTGDIVECDEDGFLKIVGRAKRFAKIAGEMISLAAIETVINNLWPHALHAIINIPDPKRGEQLILFTTASEIDRKILTTALAEHGINVLAVPKDIRIMAKLPLMGNGKIDYQQLHNLTTK